ncbi:MAG: hypothetical protein AB4368_25075 [Xenococcaceae cyanobacterium]
MNLQQLETNLDLLSQQPLNTRFLNVIAHLNPCLDRDETLLLSYYKQVRATWSTSAIRRSDSNGTENNAGRIIIIRIYWKTLNH